MSERIALVSDVHGRLAKLRAVLIDAQARGVEEIVSLGDVGGDDCVDLLRRAGVLAVFGNYEVSGWRRLSEPQQEWVKGWLPSLSHGRFLAVHAVPWWPEHLDPGRITVQKLGLWMRQTGSSWREVFPYLSEDENHLWRALAELHHVGRSILFHGHTHRQTIWRVSKINRLGEVTTTAVEVRDGERYVVGVGSVGMPDDGGWASYTLYDGNARRFEQIRLSGAEPQLAGAYRARDQWLPQG